MTASAEEKELGPVDAACTIDNSPTPSPPELHVITGGGGFVGQHIAKALREKGHQVVLFDVRKPKETSDAEMKFIQVSHKIFLFPIIFKKYYFNTFILRA